MGAALRLACPCLPHSRPGEEKSLAEQKRLRKLERKEQDRQQSGIKKREKRREHKQRRKESRRVFLAAMTDEERESFIANEKGDARAREDEGQACLKQAYLSGRPRVVVNCSFAENMARRDLTSLAKQLQLSYTAVRDLRSPIQLHFTSLHSGNPGMYILNKIGYEKWLVHAHTQSVWDLFEPAQLVVLSPDAEEDLDEVLEDKVYVIGGLVDRVIQRNQTKAQAEAQGDIALRRLPIKTFGPPGMYPVLNIDVVVSILHERLTRGKDSDWREILLHCMPQRQKPGPSRQKLRKERKADRKTAAAAEGEGEGEGEGGHVGKDGMLSDVETQSEGASSCESKSTDSDAGVAKAHPQPMLRQGAQIEIDGFGSAKVISLGILPQGKHQGKYKIRYHDGSLYHLLPEQISRVVHP